MKARDLMAPDTDPTDEELSAVMQDALNLALERRALSDAWVAARLEEAAQFARDQRLPRAHQEDERSWVRRLPSGLVCSLWLAQGRWPIPISPSPPEDGAVLPVP